MGMSYEGRKEEIVGTILIQDCGRGLEWSDEKKKWEKTKEEKLFQGFKVRDDLIEVCLL